MKPPARVIIPAWGEGYVQKLLSITLPAVMAPGNLPALCRSFDVEIVIVTETRLFDLVRGAPAFRESARICATKLAALDDVLAEFATDYGITLTHALFRGFSDLGPRMTETYLLFFNADFVVCDGALGRLSGLMHQGKRVIHAPSFRVVAEDVVPRLSAAVDGASCVLSLGARDLVRLALAHKHPTVKARTVNQRVCHQSWMDQFYWYVDEDTLIGYQAPVALVAIRPERIVTKPVLVWDFGFLPEVAPDAERYFITDSDDFFMIELQSRDTGREMIRIGWTTSEQIAHDLSMWLTKEHRESCKQLLTIHASDRPPDLDAAIAEARSYMAEVERRLAPMPASHVDHPFLSRWFREVTAQSSDAEQHAQDSPAAGAGRRSSTMGLLDRLQAIYSKTFGLPPHVGRYHPLWVDTMPLSQAIAAWRSAGENNILWISSRPSLLRRMGGERVDFCKALSGDFGEGISPRAPYDACICELSLLELLNIEILYANLRPRIKEGGQILVYVAKGRKVSEGAALVLQEVPFPSVDVSQIHFWGDALTWLLSTLYLRASCSFQSRPVARALTVGAVLLLLAPLVRLSNARAARRASTMFRPTWTSLTIEFTVRRAPSLAGKHRPQASVA